jgi:hypothetical protein
MDFNQADSHPGTGGDHDDGADRRAIEHETDTTEGTLETNECEATETGSESTHATALMRMNARRTGKTARPPTEYESDADDQAARAKGYRACGNGRKARRNGHEPSDGESQDPTGVLLDATRDACAAHGARPYQVEMALACVGHFAKRLAGTDDTEATDGGLGIAGSGARRSRSVLIQSPTGSGKTFVGLLCAAVLQSQLGLRVGWCAGRRELLRQACEENRKFGFGLEMSTISMYDRRPPKVDVLVIDEAHHDGALSMATLHGVIDPSIVIGLTATPFRRDRVKLCFERTVRTCSIQRLVDDGYLSAYRHFTVPDWKPLHIARLYAVDRERWGQSVVFFQKRAEAEECVGELAARGVRVELVTGTSDRDRQIGGFRRGETEVLVSMNVLTEGFDCPSIRTVFCRPASRLPTVQMCGRAFRRHEHIRMKQIVQARGSALPMTRVVRPAEQHVLTETGWRSLGSTRELDAEIERMRKRLAQITVVLPPVIARRKQRGRRVPRPAAG